jgi:hypothetical protein
MALTSRTAWIAATALAGLVVLAPLAAALLPTAGGLRPVRRLAVIGGSDATWSVVRYVPADREEDSAALAPDEQLAVAMTPRQAGLEWAPMVLVGFPLYEGWSARLEGGPRSLRTHQLRALFIGDLGRAERAGDAVRAEAARRAIESSTLALTASGVIANLVYFGAVLLLFGGLLRLIRAGRRPASAACVEGV